MDVKTGLVGVKRRISHQSIAEQLYIEPHQGIKSQSWSRDQIRRAVAGLVRTGVLAVHSEGLHLILKCPLATLGYSVQNKAAINPPYEATIPVRPQSLENSDLLNFGAHKADIAEASKAAIPLKEDNYYIFLLSQFEEFWKLYPLKKSQQKALEQFQALNPSPQLCTQIINALKDQSLFTQQLKAPGQWVAPGKYPANWLAQHCWNDELTMEKSQEYHHAKRQAHPTKQQSGDSLWDSCKSGIECEEASNVVELSGFRKNAQTY
jgi:hypothetical protein